VTPTKPKTVPVCRPRVWTTAQWWTRFWPRCDASITELNLGDSNGTTVWDADVWDYYIVEHKVTIDAASGELRANKQV